MHIRTPRGAARWSTSTVAHLLKKSEAAGLK
jgi:hypothetical protein